MDDLVTLMKAAAIAGSMFCFGAYIYAYVFRPKGNRRLHVASLLFSGVALASVIGIMPQVVTPGTAVAGVTMVTFLLLSVLFQAMTAFRGRSGDRREARAPEAAPVAVAAVEAEEPVGATARAA
jgi:hypothetical protein